MMSAPGPGSLQYWVFGLPLWRSYSSTHVYRYVTSCCTSISRSARANSCTDHEQKLMPDLPRPVRARSGGLPQLALHPLPHAITEIQPSTAKKEL